MITSPDNACLAAQPFDDEALPYTFLVGFGKALKGEGESPQATHLYLRQRPVLVFTSAIAKLIVSTLPCKLLGSCIQELLDFRIKALISTVFRYLRVGTAGGGCHWFLSEVLPAVNLKKSRWRQPHAGVTVKSGGGTIGEDVLAHESLLGEWGYGLSQAYSQVQV